MPTVYASCKQRHDLLLPAGRLPLSIPYPRYAGFERPCPGEPAWVTRACRAVPLIKT